VSAPAAAAPAIIPWKASTDRRRRPPPPIFITNTTTILIIAGADLEASEAPPNQVPTECPLPGTRTIAIAIGHHPCSSRAADEEDVAGSATLTIGPAEEAAADEVAATLRAQEVAVEEAAAAVAWGGSVPPELWRRNAPPNEPRNAPPGRAEGDEEVDDFRPRDGSAAEEAVAPAPRRRRRRWRGLVPPLPLPKRAGGFMKPWTAGGLAEETEDGGIPSDPWTTFHHKAGLLIRAT